MSSSILLIAETGSDITPELAAKYNVSMPIIEQVNKVLFENKPASETMKDLMTRDKKSESTDLSW